MPHSQDNSIRRHGLKTAWAEVVLAFLLAAIAGWIDAVGFLHFGGLFVSFMSGNTTRLGVDIGHADPLLMLLPAVVIACFVLGAFAGTLIYRGARGYGGALVLAVVALTLCAALVLHGRHGIEAVFAGLLAAAMGMQNTAMQGVAGHAVGLTYLTGNLTKLGQNLALMILGEDTGRKCLLFAGIWAAMFSGAIGGALAHTRADLAALGPVMVLLGIIAILRAAYVRMRH